MENDKYRIGHGYDVHRLEEGKKFIIGGIEVDHYKGAIGHSDADIVIHVICDALLGAMNMGDIGSHFPDTDEKYKNIALDRGLETEEDRIKYVLEEGIWEEEDDAKIHSLENEIENLKRTIKATFCLLYTSPSPRDS